MRSNGLLKRLVLPVALLVGAGAFLASRPSKPAMHIDLSRAPQGARIPLSGAQAAMLSGPEGGPPVVPILNVPKRLKHGGFVWNDTRVNVAQA